MDHLSMPIAEMQERYDAVVVGSGYGGGVVASRIAETGRRVCVLERGRELLPGDYPVSWLEAVRETQGNLGHLKLGSRTAMFDFHVGKSMSVLVGCGLGGTSLINANVALKPTDAIFHDPRWPTALRVGLTPELEEFFTRAQTMLGSQPYPSWEKPLGKLAAFEKSAGAIGQYVVRPDINVTFVTSTSKGGVTQDACTLCGNCVSGCNVGAKNTVLMNYLPYAKGHGAQIFTEVEVRTVSPTQRGWQVECEIPGDGPTAKPRMQSVSADTVILAAGTLGSTAILLRSQNRDLEMSQLLGDRFSGNGDALGYEYAADIKVNGVGWESGQHDPPDAPVGPCITGMIDLRGDDPEGGLVIQEGAMPGALRPLLNIPMAIAAAQAQRRVIGRFGALLVGISRLASGRGRRDLARSESYLVMGADDDEGTIVLDGDVVRVDWNTRDDRPVIRRDYKLLRKLASGINATFLEDPLWTKALGRSLITVHPLGGCVMGDDRSTGVVDHCGRVFNAGDPDIKATHDGLYVADGSIIPLPLVANPSLTIAALAERIADLLVVERGWS